MPQIITVSLHIIIDGYNIIRQSPELSRVDAEDIQLGREALLDLLSSYRKLRPHRMTVVFDGTRAPWTSPRRDRFKGIAIEFSRQGETADEVIKRMASQWQEQAMVVSSDNAVASHAARQGCAVVSSPEFEDKLRMAAFYGDEPAPDEGREAWKPTTRKKGPSRRLPKRERVRRRKMKKL